MSVVVREPALPGDTLKAKLARLKIDERPSDWLLECYDTDETARYFLDRLLFGPDEANPVYKSLPKARSYFVLAAKFVRPKDTKTKGGIILPGKTLDEDIYQGRASLVIGIGPDAYRSDEYRKWTEPNCRLGDWIVSRDSWDWSYRKTVVSTIKDDMVHAMVPDPYDTLENA